MLTIVYSNLVTVNFLNFIYCFKRLLLSIGRETGMVLVLFAKC